MQAEQEAEFEQRLALARSHLSASAAQENSKMIESFDFEDSPIIQRVQPSSAIGGPSGVGSVLGLNQSTGFQSSDGSSVSFSSKSGPGIPQASDVQAFVISPSLDASDADCAVEPFRLSNSPPPAVQTNTIPSNFNSAAASPPKDKPMTSQIAGQVSAAVSGAAMPLKQVTNQRILDGRADELYQMLTHDDFLHREDLLAGHSHDVSAFDLLKYDVEVASMHEFACVYAHICWSLSLLCCCVCHWVSVNSLLCAVLSRLVIVSHAGCCVSGRRSG